MTAGAALYSGRGVAVGDSPWPNLQTMFQALPVCRTLLPTDELDTWNGTVALICGVPEAETAEIPDDILADLVAVAARDEAIAFHGTTDTAVLAVMSLVMDLSGGRHD